MIFPSKTSKPSVGMCMDFPLPKLYLEEFSHCLTSYPMIPMNCPTSVGDRYL